MPRLCDVVPEDEIVAVAVTVTVPAWPITRLSSTITLFGYFDMTVQPRTTFAEDDVLFVDITCVVDFSMPLPADAVTVVEPVPDALTVVRTPGTVEVVPDPVPAATVPGRGVTTCVPEPSAVTNAAAAAATIEAPALDADTIDVARTCTTVDPEPDDTTAAGMPFAVS
ncbi:hypothetical protein [Rhodococcoides fascians]|uniref:hypothetical protein n=1 Tax=Rhodococcoides fascians TaxID=1828 RepID=UPI000A61A460|nr:hypothetical protein [Rhodococcus fascians]